MIGLNEDNLLFLSEDYWVSTGKLVAPYLELIGENAVDKAFLIHIKREIEQYNEEMYEEKVKEVIRTAKVKQHDGVINIPLSFAVYEVLKEEGYLKSYKEWKE